MDVLVNYRTYKVPVRVGGSLQLVASVSDGGAVEFSDPDDGPASENVLTAVAEFFSSMELGVGWAKGFGEKHCWRKHANHTHAANDPNS